MKKSYFRAESVVDADEPVADEAGVVAEPVEVVETPVAARAPVFSADGVLLNPGDCVVGADGVVRGRE